MRNRIFYILLLFIFFISFLHAQDIPLPSGYFTDATNTLSGIEEQMESYGRELKEKTGCEIGVLVIHSLNTYSVEDYAYQVFNEWGIGEKTKNNGVLFLLAIEERKARIEVGYGLEYLITEEKATGFLLDYAVPYFKNNNWDDGLLSTIRALTGYLIANYNPEEDARFGFTATTHGDETTKEFSYTQRSKSSGVNNIIIWFLRNNIHFYLLIAFFIFNLVLHFLRKFLIIPILAAEIASGLFLFILVFIFVDDEDYRILNIILFACAGIVYIIQYINNINHKCPKCGKYLNITSHTITSATYTRSGRGRRDYNCSSCGYHKSTYYTIPMKTRSSSSSGGYSSSSYSSSSSSSFGGGSSGGSGASVGF